MKLKKYILSSLFILIQNNKMMKNEEKLNKTYSDNLEIFKTELNNALKDKFPTETLTSKNFLDQSKEFLDKNKNRSLLENIKSLIPTDNTIKSQKTLIKTLQSIKTSKIDISSLQNSDHLLLTEFVFPQIINNVDNIEELKNNINKNNPINNKTKILTSFFNTKFFFIATVFSIAVILLCWKFKEKQLSNDTINDTIKDIISKAFSSLFIQTYMFLVPIIVYSIAIALHFYKECSNFSPNNVIKNIAYKQANTLNELLDQSIE